MIMKCQRSIAKIRILNLLQALKNSQCSIKTSNFENFPLIVKNKHLLMITYLSFQDIVSLATTLRD